MLTTIEIFEAAALARKRRKLAAPSLDGNYGVAAVPIEGQSIVLDGEKFSVMTVHLVAWRVGAQPPPVAAHVWIL